MKPPSFKPLVPKSFVPATTKSSASFKPDIYQKPELTLTRQVNVPNLDTKPFFFPGVRTEHKKQQMAYTEAAYQQHMQTMNLEYQLAHQPEAIARQHRLETIQHEHAVELLRDAQVVSRANAVSAVATTGTLVNLADQAIAAGMDIVSFSQFQLEKVKSNIRIHEHEAMQQAEVDKHTAMAQVDVWKQEQLNKLTIKHLKNAKKAERDYGPGNDRKDSSGQEAEGHSASSDSGTNHE